MLEIMKASEDDMQEILNIQKLAFQENAVRYNDPNIPPLIQTSEEFIDKAKGHIILKAVMDGKIVGSAKGIQNGNRCRISNVIVHPDHWNKGIGGRLVEAIESEFNVDVYELVTGYRDDKNISLYEKHGYAISEGYFEKITERLFFIHMSKRNDMRS